MEYADDLVGYNCELPGMTIIFAYATYCVMTSGSFCFAVLLLAFFWKIMNLLAALICPVSFTRLKRRM